MPIDRDFEHEHRAMIAVAQACWRPVEPSYSWHVLDWMCWKLRLKYPPIMGGGIINMNFTGT